MKILGIETSCDETAAAVVNGQGDAVEILSNIISSQIDIHKKYGGIVPEVAAREHVLSILPVINEALDRAGIKREEVLKKVDALAVTVGPGLITSLIVGVETAKTLSYAWQLPVVAVNHIEGHIYANFIRANSKSQITNSKQIPNHKSQIPNIKFPAMVLTVSGGHTLLVLMRGHGDYKIIGETRDDAAGEAFDKAAQLLGLGFPGGPVISTYAEKIKDNRSRQIQNSISLPRPMIASPNYDFSFSGLKTALLYKLKKDLAWPKLRGASKNWKKKIPEYAYEFQQAVVDVLVNKTIKAAREFKVKTVMVTGGVSANKALRMKMKETIKKELSGVDLLIPDIKYTTDNAAMIATAGYFHARRKDFTPWQKLKADCNLELK